MKTITVPHATKSVRYHLRFQILPDTHAPTEARALARFCQAHGIEEVALFFAAEEWNNGLLSRAEEDRWFQSIAGIKRVLDKAGIAVSLNPWMTVLHAARGREFPKDRRFQPMVSPEGVTFHGVASIADPRWQRYIGALYGRFATLGFRVIWVEDDFRYHNHGFGVWGGGFEELVLRRFSRKIGRRVTRGDVVKKILQPGRPHPWRALWMENWRAIHLQAAAFIAQSVASQAPTKTRLGLMSSHPSQHSIEGRDWQSLFRALRIDGEVAHRPHYAGYTDWCGKEEAYAIMMLDRQRQFRPAQCEVAPEVENFPFTHWTKSDALTWAEMAFCLFHGSDSLLLDLFPFSGNRPQAEPHIGRLLDRSRPALEWISARFDRSFQTNGVGLLWREDAASHVRTENGVSLDELSVPPFGGGEFLLSYGVPVSAHPQPVSILFGTLTWALDDTTLRQLLAGGLWLDGQAAHILCRRGYARFLGLSSARLVGREEAAYSVERVVSRETGVASGFHFNHNLQPRVAQLQPADGAREWTSLLTAEGKRFGSAITTFTNKLGGKVATLAACTPADLPRSYQKQTIVHRLLDFLSARDRPIPRVSGAPHLLPIHFSNGSQRFIVVFNGSPDPATPVIALGKVQTQKVTATILTPLGIPASAKCAVHRHGAGAVVESQTALPYLGFLVLEY